MEPSPSAGGRSWHVPHRDVEMELELQGGHLPRFLEPSRIAKTRPPRALEDKAKVARSMVLHILVRTMEQDPEDMKYKPHLGCGTGFIIKSTTKGSIVLTAAHVIARTKGNPRSKIFVRQMTSRGVQQFEARLLEANYRADVAILQVNGIKESRENTPLVFSSNEPKKQRAIIVAYSNPHQLFKKPALTTRASISPGQILHGGKLFNYRSGDIKTRTIQVNCVAMKGNSGAPVIDNLGVIGMVTSGRFSKTNAVCLDTITDVLKSYLRYPAHSEHGLEELVLEL